MNLLKAAAATVAIAALAIGCGSSGGKSDEFEGVTLEDADTPIRQAFERAFRAQAEGQEDVSDANITCMISGTREEISDEELTQGAAGQVNNPGAAVPSSIQDALEKVADDCGVDLNDTSP